MPSIALSRRTMLTGALAAALTAAAPQAKADVYVRIGPPAAHVEVIPPPPVGPHRWVWVPGYWQWNGDRYIWYRGEYIRWAHGNWRPGHWEHRPGGWVWFGGGWY
jgi:hypothetical protein